MKGERDEVKSPAGAVQSQLNIRDQQSAEVANASQRSKRERDETHGRRALTEHELNVRAQENSESAGQVCRLEGERERTREQNQELRAASKLLKLETEVIRPRVRQPDMMAILRSELHSLWNSWSWMLFRPLRNFVRLRRGLGKESEPIL